MRQFVRFSLFFAAGVSSLVWFANPINAAEPLGGDISAGIAAGQTRAEAKIEAALDEPTDFEFNNASIADVAKSISQRHKIEVQLDSSIDEAGVSDDRITRHLKQIPLRSALDLALGSIELTYVPRHGVLLICAVSQAERLHEVRVYPIRDLLPRSSVWRLPSADFNEAYPLIEMLESTVAPTTWVSVGGTGAIHYSAPACALVIDQTYQVHREIHDVLVALRSAKKIDQEGGPVRDEQKATFAVGTYTVSTMYLSLSQTAAPPEARRSRRTGDAKRDDTSNQKVSPPTIVGELAELIPEIVEKDSWQQAGGKGWIRAIGDSLVLQQTEETYRKVGDFLLSIGAIQNPNYTGMQGGNPAFPGAAIPGGWTAQPGAGQF